MTPRTWRRVALLAATLILAGVAAPAGAEPAPVVDGLTRVGTAPGAAGTVGTPRPTGRARLGTSAPVTVSVPVTLPYPGHIDLAVTVAGRTCARGLRLPAGTTSVPLRCDVTAGPGDIPATRGTVTVRLTRGTGGLLSVTDRTATATWPTAEGEPLSDRDAAARWRTVADALAAKAEGLQEPTFGAAFTGSQVWLAAFEEGWGGHRTHHLLADLVAARNPDGGYGLSQAWDAYGDGTKNPPTTSYTVTTAAHVGGTLLEAYRQGVLDFDPVARAVDSLLGTPRLDRGTCLAYSTSPNDARKPCVYNVSLGAAAFLVRVRQVSDYRAAEVDALVRAVRARLADGYDRVSGYWAYAAGVNGPQDMSHQIYTASSAEILDPAFGALDRMMVRPWWSQPGGLVQPPSVVASAMLSLAGASCRYARVPGVLAGAQRPVESGAPAFVVLAMANQARAVLKTCFDRTAAAPGGSGIPVARSQQLAVPALG